MAAPSIVGSTYTQAGNGSNSTTLVVNVPTNTDGNLIVVVYITDADSPTTASISGSGWTTLEGPQDVSNTTIGTAGVFYVWYKTASSDSGSYTITASNSERAVAIGFAVSGHNGIDVENTYATGTDTSAESGNLTTTVNDALRISIVGSTGVRTVSTLTDHTLLVTQSYTSAGTLSVQYKTIASAGADTGRTATLDSGGWCSYAFAIKPASGSAYNQTAAGSMTPSGVLVRSTTKKVAGSVTPTGAVSKRTSKSFAGSITPTGALATARVFLKSMAGALTPTGALVRSTTKKVAGSITPTGSIVRNITKKVAGSLTPTGLIRRTAQKALAGALGLVGALIAALPPGNKIDVTITEAIVTTLTLTSASVTEVTLSDVSVTSLTMENNAL